MQHEYARSLLSWGPSQGLLVAAVVSITACGAQQRAAEKLIDPRLRSEGVLVERVQGERDLELGRYRVVGLSLEEEPFDGTGPLAPDAEGRTRPTQQFRLRFTLAGGQAPWTARCVGQRRQPPDHDLAAAADELRDEVAVHCELARERGAGQRWVLRVAGDLGSNVLGELEPAAGSADAGASKVVEIVMWHQLWNVTRRRMPASLGLIRGDLEGTQGTEAALILDKPERAWLAPELSEAERELALTSLLALRLLPLGFDG